MYKKTLLLLFIFFLFLSCSNPTIPDSFTNNDTAIKSLINTNHPKGTIYQSLLDDFVKKGIPGAILLIEDSVNGVWAGTSGKANLSNNTPMQLGNILNIASVTKLFTAVSLLKTLDQYNIEINSLVKDYLPKYCNQISNSQKSTFKQLLNHTSGIFNFTENTKWYLDILNDKSKKMYIQDQLAYAYGIEAYADTGVEHNYSNTGYLMLGLALDSILGYDHHIYFNDSIFKNLNMDNAIYKSECTIPDGIVSGYMDFHGDGILTDVSDCSFGFGSAEGGIICSIYDLYLFSHALFKDDLLSSHLFTQMTTFIDTKKNEPISQSFGLGIEKLDTKYGDIIGHLGQNIGYSAYLYYFPESDITVILMLNVGAAGKPHEIITDFIITSESKNENSKLFDAIFK